MLKHTGQRIVDDLSIIDSHWHMSRQPKMSQPGVSHEHQLMSVSMTLVTEAVTRPLQQHVSRDEHRGRCRASNQDHKGMISCSF